MCFGSAVDLVLLLVGERSLVAFAGAPAAASFASSSAAAVAIANVIDEAVLLPDYIVPSVFDPGVVPAVANAVAAAAREDGVARKGMTDDESV